MNNSRLPQLITNDLRLDSMVFDRADNRLDYYYSVLTDSARNSMSAKDLQKVRQKMVDEIRDSRELEMLCSRKVTFEYIYIAEPDRSVIAKIAITPSEYK